jgi:hypothetical protein
VPVSLDRDWGLLFYQMTTIYFEKKDGEVLEKEKLIEKLNSSLRLLKNGAYELSHKQFKKNRSNDQNALMWMWFECLSQETGSSRDDFHDYYCKKFLKRS